MNSYTTSVPERVRRAKRKLPAASTTTQRVIDYLVSLSDPNVRRDPEVTTTALEMMRVQRSTIRRAVGGALCWSPSTALKLCAATVNSIR